jgi:hypothetical protein
MSWVRYHPSMVLWIYIYIYILFWIVFGFVCPGRFTLHEIQADRHTHDDSPYACQLYTVYCISSVQPMQQHAQIPYFFLWEVLRIVLLLLSKFDVAKTNIELRIKLWFQQAYIYSCWFRNCATSWKVAGSILDDAVGFPDCLNPSSLYLWDGLGL